jgi:hypothetical protein
LTHPLVDMGLIYSLGTEEQPRKARKEAVGLSKTGTVRLALSNADQVQHRRGRQLWITLLMEIALIGGYISTQRAEGTKSVLP